MRRSSKITLVAMATVSCVALTACDDKKSKDTEVVGDFYSSVQQCVDAKDPTDTSKALYTPEECKTQFEKAEQEHAANAPKFNSLKDCEDQFGPGECGSSPVAQGSSTTIVNNNGGGNNSSGVFMPFMMGYLFGHATSAPTPVYYGPGSWHDPQRDNRPLYASGGSYYNPNSRSKPLGYVERNVSGYSQTIATPSNLTGGRPSDKAVSTSMSRNGFSPGNYSTRSSAFGSQASRSFSPPSSTFSSRSSVSAPSSSRGGFGGMSSGRSGGFGG